jgi:hypothetical protein
MSAFKIYKDLALVQINDLRSNAEKVISSAQSQGALFGTIIKARGMIRQSKRLRFRPLSISPQMESILLVTPIQHLESVVKQAILTTEIQEGAIGAVLGIPVSRVFTTEYNSGSSKTIDSARNGNNLKLQKSLKLITCICQKGKADGIANAAVFEGSGSPIIHYGEGKGVRDRMGLLKIAVNPEKEVIYVVTDHLESDRIFDAMVEAGNLYAPGMGFIYTTNISTGFVNLHTTLSTSHTEATVEQIIKAIDELKGNKNWRIANTGLSAIRRPQRKTISNLVNLKLVTRRGLGDEFIYEAMHSGAHGATRSYAQLIGGEQVLSQTGRVINDEREIIDFHVVPETAVELLKVFEELVLYHESKNSFIVEIPVPRALTYFG